MGRGLSHGQYGDIQGIGTVKFDTFLVNLIQGPFLDLEFGDFSPTMMTPFHFCSAHLSFAL